MAAHGLDALQGAVQATIDELTCCICLAASTDPVALVCGHIGCSGCITEWLARKAECPLCKHACSRDISACVKVHAIDSVLSKLLGLHQAVDALRLDAVMHATPTAAPADASSEDAISALFRSHVRAAMDTATGYVQQLKSERDAAIAAADADAAAVAARGDSAAAAQAAEMAGLAKQRAHAVYTAAYAALQADVEAYLKTAAAPVTLMPAMVTVAVPSLGVRFDMRVRPMDNIAANIIAHVKSCVLETQRADVVTFPSDVVWTCTAPTAAAPVTLTQDTPLFPQFAGGRPPAKAVLTCTGAVTAASSRASRCLSDVWTAGTKEDFFWCTTCALKWICTNCADTCHRAAGHNVVPFLKQHAATFACCYCKTRSKCSLSHKAATPAGAASASSGAAATPAAGAPTA